MTLLHNHYLHLRHYYYDGRELEAVTSMVDAHSIDYTRLMMEHTPVNMGLYDTQDFRLLSANSSFLKAVGRTQPNLPYHDDELLGQPLDAWFPASSVKEMLTIFRYVAKSLTPYRRTEYPIHLSNGQIAYWNWSLHPIFDEQGCTNYLLHTAMDVTDQVHERYKAGAPQEKQQTALLPNVESHIFRAVLDQLSDGILIADVATGLTTYANEAAARFLGLPLATLLRTPLHRYMQLHNETNRSTSQDDSSLEQINTVRVPWLFPVIHALCGKTVNAQETVLTHPDGSTQVVTTSCIPLRTEQGIISGAVVIFQDLATQKSLSQYKQEFFSTVSHELRTPITTIQGLAELLQLSISKGRSLDSSHVERVLHRLSGQSQQLAHLVEELLDVSLLEQKQFVLNSVRCDLLPLVVSSVEYFTSVSVSPKHSLHLSLEGPVAVETLIGRFDKERIIQMLHNLISHAIKYSPSGGHIEVTLRHIPEKPYEAILTVRNEGHGISAPDLPHVFERFHRSASADPALSDLGIGLYLVKEIATRHGGRAWAESVEGQGSTFYVVLPLEDRRE